MELFALLALILISYLLKNNWKDKTKLQSNWIIIFSLLLSPFVAWFIAASLSIKHDNKRNKTLSILSSLVFLSLGSWLIFSGFTTENYYLLYPKDLDYTQNIISVFIGTGLLFLGLYMTTYFDGLFIKKEFLKHN